MSRPGRRTADDASARPDRVASRHRGVTTSDVNAAIAAVTSSRSTRRRYRRLPAAMFPGAFVDSHTGDKPAVVMAGSGFTQTFAELDAAANRLSRVLRSAGLEPGDHVAFCMENHDRYLEVLWGCHYAGLIYTAASSRLTSGELRLHPRRLRGEGVHHVAVSRRPGGRDPRRHARGAVAVDARRHDRRVRELRGRRSPRQSSEPLADRIAGTDMLYSSGTTGRPKGVLQPFEQRPLETSAMAVAELLQALYGATSESVYLSPAPLYHAAPLRFCMAMHTIGSTVVVMEHFDAEQYLQLVETLSHHAQPGRADDVRPDDEARPRGAQRGTTCRRCSASSMPPRRARSR